jgi:hypothetical protein
VKTFRWSLESARWFSWQHRIFLVIQLGVAVWASWLYFHIPTPGWAVAILAVVAAAMSIHGEMRGWQKAIWMLLIAALLRVELRAISKDRTETEANALHAQKVQEESFGAIRQRQDADFRQTAQDLQTEIQQSKALMTQIVQTNETAQKTLRNVTGGDSFVVLERLWGDVKSPESTIGPNWIMYSQGDANLHQINAQIVDLDRFDAVMRDNPKPSYAQIQQLYLNVSLGDMASNSSRTLTIPALGQGQVKLNIFFSGMNGFWIENYTCRQINGTMVTALRVFRQDQKKEKVIFKKINPGFPVDSSGHPLDQEGKPIW